MYRVVKCFTDLQDGHKYNVGDVFPIDGVKVDKARLEKLASHNNRQKAPLIEKIEHSTAGSSLDSPARQEVVGQDTPLKKDGSIEKRRSGKRKTV